MRLEAAEMTTVAYRDGILAGDSLMVDRGVRCGHFEKVRRVGDLLVGMAGAACWMGPFLRWVGSEFSPESLPRIVDDNFEALIITPDGRVDWFGQTLVPVRMFGDFTAIGSGFPVAMGAMSAGASAVRALEIACELDTMTGGPIISIGRPHHP